VRACVEVVVMVGVGGRCVCGERGGGGDGKVAEQTFERHIF
jgi:hypothetical protein